MAVRPRLARWLRESLCFGSVFMSVVLAVFGVLLLLDREPGRWGHLATVAAASAIAGLVTSAVFPDRPLEGKAPD